jgi:hypothetical protein
MNQTMETTTQKTIHPFEAAGLGLAPFRYVRFYQAKYQACQGAPIQPGASCDYCGTGIMNVYVINSSDGKEFKTGCDCVYKTFAKTDTVVKEVKRAQRNHLREIHAAVREAKAEKARVARNLRFLSEHDGLEQALTADHDITRDLAEKLGRYGSLSERQVDLAFRLYARAYGPQRQETNIPAPTGKQTIQGKIVSAKSVEGPFGYSVKITVKVDTGAGVWLCWGTCPAGLLTDLDGIGVPLESLKGREVKFNATLVPGGRDTHFAFFKRPTKPQTISLNA